MKLVIREYLSLLKESKELDSLLPTLLLEMGWEVISKPQIGIRQHGVDLSAIGKDENGNDTLYLFTVKCGDIGRTEWDSIGIVQSVRPSLNEIKDVHIRSLPQKYKSLPKKIILVTGGDLKQEVQPNWDSYIDENSSKLLSFEFWGGDKLAIYIDRYLLNDSLFPKEVNIYLRKTLALLENNDDDLLNFRDLLKKHLLSDEFKNMHPKKISKLAVKRLKTINLILNIIHSWAKANNNLKPALLCAEKSILHVWDFIQKNELCENKDVCVELNNVYSTLENIFSEYYEKLKPYCYVENGLCIITQDFILECINLFEVLGFISIYGLIIKRHKENVPSKNYEERLKNIQNTLMQFIENHKALYNPCYDNQIIEIILAILVLSENSSHKEYLSHWINQINKTTAFAYGFCGIHFPISSDSIESLIDLNINSDTDKRKMLDLSTLIPILSQICAVMSFEDAYKNLQDNFKEYKDFCNFQIWYPNKDTEAFFYTTPYNVYETGSTDISINIDIPITEMVDKIKQVQINTLKRDEIIALVYSADILPLIACRHYRLPIFPIYWQQYIL